MEANLRKRIVGQEEAIISIAKAVRRARAGLKDPRRPIGSFMFLGPTGVGKTELTKALAEFMFGSEDALIQLDMSEFMERHTVARMIGSPPGYVGYEDAGQLTEAFGAAPTPSSSLTRSKRRIRMRSTSSSRSWRRASSPTPRATGPTFATR
jgi:ATP-dependent Clp protease ATP-binding subunit ClpC